MPNVVDLNPHLLKADHNPLEQMSSDPTAFLANSGGGIVEELGNALFQLPKLAMQAIIDALTNPTKLLDLILMFPDVAFGALHDFLAGFPFIGPLIDALLGGSGFGLGDISTYFGNIEHFLADINFLSPTFNPVAAVTDFINLALIPVNLIAPLFGGLIPGLNIPGLDASKIISGEFEMSMIHGLIDFFSGLATNIPILGQFVTPITGIANGTLDDLTGFFSGFAAGIPIVGQLVQVFTGGTGTLTDLQSWAGTIPLIGPLVQAITGTALGGLPDITHFFSGFTSGIPLVGQIVSAFTGGSASTAGLGDIGSWLTAVPMLISGLIPGGLIPGLDTSKIVSGTFADSFFPGFGSLINTFIGFLSGGALSSGSLGVMSGLLGNIPLLGPLLGAFSGSSLTGGGGLGGITSFFTDFLGVIGSPTGLGTGAVTMGTSIPLFGPLIDTVVSALGGSGTGLGLGSLFSILQNIPGLNIISTLSGSVIPGLDASKIVSGFFPMSMVSGLFDTLAGFLTGSSPLDAFNLFGLLPANLFGTVPIGALSPAQPNMLPLGTFAAGTIAANPQWILDAATTATADSSGSAKIIANGLQHHLRGVNMPVAEAQTLDLSIKVKWASLSATGSPIQLGVVKFLAGVEVGVTTVASISSPGANQATFTPLTGTYTVPAGVDAIRFRFGITPEASSGSVWFDDAICKQTGVIQQDWVHNLTGQFSGIADLFGLAGVSNLLGPDINSAWTSIVHDIIDPFNFFANLVGGVLPDSQVPALLTNLIGIFGAGLTQVGHFVTNLLSLFGLGNVSAINILPSVFSVATVISNFVTTIINPLNLLAALSGGLISGSIIPGLDGSKITTGTISPAITQLQTVVDAVTGGTTHTVANLGSSLAGTASELLSGFTNIFNAWFNSGSGVGSSAQVNTTVANMRTVIINGYTLVTFGSNTSWTVPTCSVLYLGAIGAGGRGYDGISGNAPTAGLYQGGEGGSSGGVQMRKLDPVALGIIGSTLTVTVGSYAVASSPGANGGQSSFGYVSSLPDIGKITTPEAEWGCAATPGRGGRGGYAQVGCGAYFGTYGANGASAFGGSYGNQATGTTSASASNGSTGGAGTSGSLPISGGAGGGGGGGACATSAGSTSTGGAGGAGGFPGGGGGGGGGATATSPNPGAGSYGANGMCWALYK